MMRYVELVKYADKEALIVVGQFYDEEIQEFRAAGYKPVQFNKHGIRVV